MLKGFNDYMKQRSTDPAVWEKMVVLASPTFESDIFISVKNESQLFEYSADLPIVVWGDFNISQSAINENKFSIFNLPRIDLKAILEQEHELGPKYVTDRSQVKKMKFPIIAVDSEGEEEFKTVGKFKKSERAFSKFKSKPVIRTRFNVICHRDEPIHLQEKINGIGFDINLNSFNNHEKITSIVEKLGKMIPLDFYQATIIESDGEYYLESLDNSSELSPSQTLSIYERAYETHYARKIPKAIQTKLFETHVKKYYQKRYYDSLLIKPKNSIDFKKYV